MTDWTALTWPADALGDALMTLARLSGLRPRAIAAPRPPKIALGEDDRTRSEWICAAATHLGIEAEPVDATYAELETVLASLGVALVRVVVGGEARYLATLASNARAFTVLTPKRKRARIARSHVYSILTADLTAGRGAFVDKWLTSARVSQRRISRARRQLLDNLLAERWVSGMWILRPDPGSPFAHQLARKGVSKRAFVFGAASIAQVVLSLLGWMMIGRGALQGVVESGWLVAWVLISLSTIPFQLLASHAGGMLGLDVAALLKQRLLCGALRMDPAEIRAHGSGGLLAMVSESEAIETAGLSGTLGAIGAIVQLLSASAVLYAGSGGLLHVVLLIAWSAVIAALSVRFVRRRAAWTAQRFAITNDFVENVVGNRTRIAQQHPDLRHVLEDAMLDRYLEQSHSMDSAQDLLLSLPSRGWLTLGFVGLVPSMLGGSVDATAVVVAIGGILQAQAAFAILLTSLTSLLGAGVAWRSIGRLFDAATRSDPPGVPEASLVVAPRGSPSHDAPAVLEARGLSFRYRLDGAPVLRDCDLVLREGDRILLEGTSGGGKSTLAAILCGLHTPADGLVLLRGLDRRTIGGTGWRQRVASAPQFHENHILSATLAFNLLMGRSWPPSENDQREATLVCRKLGLGPLLDRMPSGLSQIVGETGWQLSHGERSRVFLARALLQRADVVILDESFGALDPITLGTCVDTVIERAPSLLVIAHP